MTNKYQILEPITAICRLVILAFKPKNTKISIRDYNIVLCEPSETYLGFHLSQSIDRYLHQDSRNDIVIINYVISNFIEWYIIPYKTHPIYNDLINLTKYLCVGLNELQQTYQMDNACFTIQYYINILSAIINDTYSSDMLYIHPNEIKTTTILNTDKLKTFWEFDDLISLIGQFNKCFIHTGIQYCKATWPEPKINDDIVCGYVIGIINVLNVMDKRFTNCITQSIKGIN